MLPRTTVGLPSVARTGLEVQVKGLLIAYETRPETLPRAPLAASRNAACQMKK